jgi:histidine kinase
MLEKFRHSLISKLIFSVGMTLLLSVSTWAYFNVKYQKEKIMQNIAEGTDRLSNTIKLGTHYAMMLNSRDDINQIIQNIAKQKEIENIRIYNKKGQIKFSNRTWEVDRVTNIKDEACYICHRTDPPLYTLTLAERKRIFYEPDDNPKNAGRTETFQKNRLLGIISPIYNEPGCSTDCHVHPEGKQILGALDVVVSLEETDAEMVRYETGITALTVSVFVVSSAIIFFIMLKFVRQPIQKLIDGTNRIAVGDYYSKVDIQKDYEIGLLAAAINRMGKEIGESHAELNKQRDEYQSLFELVPCLITVIDRNYNLLKYNRSFAEKFNPKPGDYCFYAYKKRDERCVNCPVEKTFEDGEPHFSEESGVNKDGTMVHWIVKTSPMKNGNGEIVGVMETCVDITPRRLLEEKLEQSEKKYHDIFNNIPNPVFVVHADTLEILNCNNSVKGVYGYDKYDLIDTSFLDLFRDEDKLLLSQKINTSANLSQIKHVNKEGKTLFVNIRISPSEYMGKNVLLITTSDITKRLETEQQLIQASKMATLGEMATGVAHELNQPLSVIKTASSFFMKKIKKKEPIKEEILFAMSSEIDSHVDRASKIINHMREFGRKSDMGLERVQINDVLKKAFEIFSQQLKLRGIDVVWELEETLPLIMGDSVRLEQVFINLLVNARDAIEDRWNAFAQRESEGRQPEPKRIWLRSHIRSGKVVIEVEDTGNGIPPEIAEKIFEPFFTTKEVGKGTGLGLSISYGIIKDCGGDIQTVPNENKGAIFMVQFPIATN